MATTGPFQPITVCPGATITPPVFTSNPAGATFGWVNSNVNIGTAASGAGQMSPWTAPVNNSNAAIAANIAVTPTFNNCPGTTASFVISINPTPSIVNTPTAQTRCSGVATAAVGFATSVAGTTVAWTGVASSGTVTGFTPSGTGGLPVMTITNSSNTPQTVTYTVIPTRNGCQGPPFTYTITINPTPVLTLSANQTICGGQTTAVTSFTNSVAGGTFSYALQSPAAVPANVTGYPTTGNGQIPASVINNGGSSPFTLNYTITPSANSCNGTTGTFSITVNPAPVTTFSQGNQTICTGQNTTLVNLSSTTPNVTFAWSLQGAVPAGLGNFNPTSGTSSIPVYANLTNNTTAPITVTLQAQATTAGAAQCPGAMANYTITVNPSPIAAANFVSNDTVCSGQSVNIALSSTTAGTTFTWTASNGAGVTGGQNSAAPSVTINQALSNSSSAVGSVTYTITPNASSCNGAPLQVLAYVNPVATIAALASPTVCPAATITPTAFVSTPNGASFAWTNTNTAIGIGASGNGQISPWYWYPKQFYGHDQSYANGNQQHARPIALFGF
ncbi:MAG: hypothetical protein EB023_08810 [Flavobacteriia bacterium]|nr:hypothetical protein [Flavobacteriia bacterium]